MPRYDALARAIVAYAQARIARPVPLDGSASAAELTERAGATIIPGGIGGDEALRVWAEVLAPATISTDHPAYLAFVPGAPTKASVLFDLAISASSIYGGSWLEGAGAVWAENQALRWIADLASMPASAGGVFVAGGTAGNLSALVTARHAAGTRGGRPARWRLAASGSAHSSVEAAARVMDVDVLAVPTDERGRLTGPALAATLEADGGDDVFAVVASAGATNAGTVDDLAGVADVCEEHGIWFHVDGAYGAAGLLADAVRPRFAGVERADSFIADPHKWLFAPFDACALLYRDPAIAREAHVQHASYLESITATPEWNPSDFAHHLTRRARGLPLWFSLGHVRHRGLPRRGRGDPHADAGDGRGDPAPSGAGAAAGSGAVGGAVPPARVGGRGLRGLVAASAGGRRSRSCSRRRGRARRSPACAS